jgi:hypothetical protein
MPLLPPVRRRDAEAVTAPITESVSPASVPVAASPVARGLILQAKLTVGSTSDPMESDADEVAAAFMSAPDTASAAPDEAAAGSAEVTSVARKESSMAGSFDAPGTVEEHIDKTAGSGQALPEAFGTKMEGMTGVDLSGVKMHTDGASSQASASIGALAFTTGQDIYFGPGGSPSDTELLAHETAHVVQQSTGRAAVDRLVSRRATGAPVPELSQDQAVDLADHTFGDLVEPVVDGHRTTTLTSDVVANAVQPTYERIIAGATTGSERPVELTGLVSSVDTALETAIGDAASSRFGFQEQSLQVAGGGVAFSDLLPRAATDLPVPARAAAPVAQAAAD